MRSALLSAVLLAAASTAAYADGTMDPLDDLGFSIPGTAPSEKPEPKGDVALTFAATPAFLANVQNEFDPVRDPVYSSYQLYNMFDSANLSLGYSFGPAWYLDATIKSSVIF